jgi:type II secretory pathway component PulF
MLKKVSFLTLLGVLLPVFVLAQKGGMEGPGANASIMSIGVAIANAVWIVFTVIAVIAFLVAGVFFLTAAGDPAKIQKAKSATLWGAAGVAVGILAFSIKTIIQGALF